MGGVAVQISPMGLVDRNLYSGPAWMMVMLQYSPEK